jgi:hypothetical protein
LTSSTPPTTSSKFGPNLVSITIPMINNNNFLLINSVRQLASFPNLLNKHKKLKWLALSNVKNVHNPLHSLHYSPATISNVLNLSFLTIFLKVLMKPSSISTIQKLKIILLNLAHIPKKISSSQWEQN